MHALFFRTTVALACAALPLLSFATDEATDPMTPGAAAPEPNGLQSVIPYTAPANVFVPESSRSLRQNAGVRAHTNYVVRNLLGIQVQALESLKQAEPAANPGPGITVAETPTSLACIYKMGTAYTGCTPWIDPAHNAVGGSRSKHERKNC